MKERLIFVSSVLLLATGVLAQSLPRSAAQNLPYLQLPAAFALRTPAVIMQQVEGVRTPVDAAWAQAGGAVLNALERTGRLSVKDRDALVKAESGLTPQQRFALRLNVLAQLVGTEKVLK